MTKKYTLLLIVVLISVGLSLTAKEKAISLKKFKSTDIGNPDISGSSEIQNNSISITAGGADVWGTQDEFRFVYIEQTGDFDLVAKIESLKATHLYTKAGLMAREDLSDNSRHIFFPGISEQQSAEQKQWRLRISIPQRKSRRNESHLPRQSRWNT